MTETRLEPTFDRDGTPAEATLERLTTWPLQDAGGALDFLAVAWNDSYGQVRHELDPCEASVVHAHVNDRFLRLATGGWANNEMLIYAFEASTAWVRVWQMSARGGLYIFKYPERGTA